MRETASAPEVWTVVATHVKDCNHPPQFLMLSLARYGRVNTASLAGGTIWLFYALNQLNFLAYQGSATYAGRRRLISNDFFGSAS